MRSRAVALLAVIALSLGLMALSPTQRLVLFGGPACGYYVSSLTGNNSNSGTSPALPLKNLGNVPAVASGSTICLQSGSVFNAATDTLFVGLAASPRNNVTVKSYGIGAPPLIDLSTQIPQADCVATGGAYANLYTCTTSLGPGLTWSTPYGTYTIVGPWINVYECTSTPCTPTGNGGNDFTLANESSESAANGQQGSVYIPGQTSSAPPSTPTALVFYIYPLHSGCSPATGSCVYTFSNRPIGIQIAGTGARISGIVVKKSSDNFGGIVQYVDGGSAILTNVEADQGGKHNASCSGGCTVSASSFNDEYYPLGNMLVFFDNTGSGLPVSLVNSNFRDGAAIPGNSITALYAHAGSGSLGAMTVTGGSIKNLQANGEGNGDLGGIGGSPASSLINGLSCRDTPSCISAAVNTTASNVSWVSPDVQGYLAAAVSGGISLKVSNSTACGVGSNAHGPIYNTQAGVAIDSENNSFYTLGEWLGYASGIYDTDTTGSVTQNHTTIGGDISTANFWDRLSGSSYTGNNNAFVLPGAVEGVYNGTTYSSLSAWQTATSQDAATVTTGSSPCPKGNLALDANATSPVYSTSAVTSLTLTTLTIGTGQNRLLIVALESGLPSTCTLDPTGANQAMTESASQNIGGGYYLSFWALPAPESGNHSIVCNFSSTSYVTMGATSFTGANQGGGDVSLYNASQASGSGTALANTVYAAPGDMAIDITAPASTTLSAPTQSELFLEAATAVGSSLAPGAATVNFGWTQSPSGTWYDLAVAIRAAF